MSSTRPDADAPEFLQRTLDSLQAHIAVLDQSGTILYTNDAWRAFASENGLTADLCGPGINYLETCDASLGNVEDSEMAANGIRAVASGVLPNFYMEYPCHSPDTQRWFSLRVTRFEIGEAVGVVVAHHTITQRKLADIALKDEQALLRRLIEVQENEKQFLCHEFHDGLIQYAVGSKMLLEGYRDKYPSFDASEIIDTVIRNLQAGIEDGRRVIRGVRPAVLDDSDLVTALNDFIEQFSTGDITVTSQYDPEIGRFPNAIQTAIYRIVQEALNNARKYSGTDVVRIELKKAHGDLHLEVRDFGRGFDVESARKRGFGIRGMTERVRLLGGEITIESEPDAGTRISVRLPI